MVVRSTARPVYGLLWDRELRHPLVAVSGDMQKTVLRFWLAALALSSALAASAQLSYSDTDIVIGRLAFLAFRPDVKTELKVTETQFAKMKAAFGDSLQVEGHQISILITGNEDLAAMEKEALAALDQSQTKRLNELRAQFIGALVLGLEKPAKEVGLSEDQKKEVATILRSTAESLQELFMAGHGEGTANEANDLRKKGSAKVLALLDEGQKRKFETLLGKPFKFKP